MYINISLKTVKILGVYRIVIKPLEPFPSHTMTFIVTTAVNLQ